MMARRQKGGKKAAIRRQGGKKAANIPDRMVRVMLIESPVYRRRQGIELAA